MAEHAPARARAPEGAAGAPLRVRARVRAGLASPGARVRLLISGMFALAAAIYVLVVRTHAMTEHTSLLPWPLLSVGFAIAELKVVDVHYRRERHAFSLSEVPGVLGLFLLAPFEYLVSIVAGSGIALLVDPRQSSVKRAFNVANVLLGAATALAIFHTLVPVHVLPAGMMPGPMTWFAAVLASLSVSVIGAIGVAAVISLSGGAPQYERLAEMIQFGGMVALANTSIALLAVSVFASNPLALVLLAIPIGTVYFAYRAYVSEREKHERLEMLYQSSRILQHSPEIDSTLVALLTHSRDMFRAEVARIVVFPDQSAITALAATSVDGGPDERMTPIPLDQETGLWRRIRAEPRAFFWAPEAGEEIGGRPIQQLMAAPLRGEGGTIGMLLIANRLSEGTTFDQDDLRLLETVANQVAVALENGQLERSLAELSRLKEQLRHQAYHDTLTGLPNRALFSDQVTGALREFAHDAAPIVMFLDLDDFKVVNDTLGHAIGDQLLVAAADRIRSCVRTVDVAARLGGDEFAVLLAAGSRMGDAMGIAQRLVDALGLSFPIGGRDLGIGASIGIAAARSSGEATDELLRNADVAMYTAKANGKRRIAVFDPLMHEELVARHELSADLVKSISIGELEVHYQPIVELRGAGTVGVEALVRWPHHDHAGVGPEEFVRLAEENGSIIALGRWVLYAACAQAAAWRRLMPAGRRFTLSVNLSPVQLQDPSFIDDVERVLGETGMDPADLVLEMTETAMLQDTVATITKLEALKSRGVRIAVDDFGTGYSSLSYLRRFPVDILKIAREFIGPPHEGIEDEGWAFARAIIALGRTLGMAIVAEGIEDPGQLEQLRQLGCQYGQGFLFRRPIPARELEAELLGPSIMIVRETGLRAPRPVETPHAVANPSPVAL